MYSAVTVVVSLMVGVMVGMVVGYWRWMPLGLQMKRLIAGLSLQGEREAIEEAQEILGLWEEWRGLPRQVKAAVRLFMLTEGWRMRREAVKVAPMPESYTMLCRQCQTPESDCKCATASESKPNDAAK